MDLTLGIDTLLTYYSIKYIIALIIILIEYIII